MPKWQINAVLPPSVQPPVLHRENPKFNFPGQFKKDWDSAMENAEDYPEEIGNGINSDPLSAQAWELQG